MERRRGRARADREVALDGQPEAIKVSAQDLGLLPVRDRAGPEPPRPPAPPQGDLAGHLGVPDPLGLPPAGHHEPLAPELQHVDRRAVHAARPPASHQQQIVVAPAESEDQQNPEGLAEHAFRRTGLPERRDLLVHGRSRLSRTPMCPRAWRRPGSWRLSRISAGLSWLQRLASSSAAWRRLSVTTRVWTSAFSSSRP